MVAEPRVGLGGSGEGSGLERLGASLLRLALVLIFLPIGLQKFTAYEAAGIAPFVVNSPLLSWAYDALGERGIASLLGVVEIAIGVALATGFFARGSRLSHLGAIGSAVTYGVTLSFLLTTPGVIVLRDGLPLSTPYPGQFLMKDMVLLAASIFLIGQAKTARRTAAGER